MIFDQKFDHGLKKSPHSGEKPTNCRGNPLVGVTGLEPMASWSRTKRDTKLRHTPMQLVYYSGYQMKNQVFL